MKEKLTSVWISKKAASILFMLLFLMTSLGLGCGDKCKKVDCVEGTCVDGTCECNEGYFGELCTQALNSNYNNNFALTENCTSGSDLYDVSILASADNNVDIKLTGLWEQVSRTVVAQVGQDAYGFTIARQQFGTKEIAGQATVDVLFEEIALSYQIFQTGASQPFEQCTAALVKK